ncbi:hypothetical protein AXG93_2225s1030 [Marchantia polymorpha subsp. ruderalis]|uniref:Uncharacterized protein n=1 Tax=Marchantia polymorpha subsp. ruderalis TaxID=1480154 RepID=A0A176W4S9_MARPO|nr:hypothetical protein AXG93_2225s1030 [Marchantia polymorpha subsp. ruderalis]
MAGSGGRRWRRRAGGDAEAAVAAAADAGQDENQEWVVGGAAETEVVEKERISKLMFRLRTAGLVGGGSAGSKRVTGGGAAGQMRALKRGARRLGRQLRRHSVRSLCCVSGSARGIGYHKLSRSSSVDSERLLGGIIPNPIAPLAEWPSWGSLGRLASLGPLGSFRCVEEAEDTVVVKVGMVGDCQTGKTSFMVNYVASQKNEDYVQTIGVTSMEKIFKVQNANIALSIWDLGGHRQFSSMMPLVCKDSDAILLMFDLTRRSTLHRYVFCPGRFYALRAELAIPRVFCSSKLAVLLKSARLVRALCATRVAWPSNRDLVDANLPKVLFALCVKQWFVQVRHCNKSAIVILVGTKYDHFVNLPEDTQRIITRQARLYAQAMDASLFFSSVTHNINVHKIFKVIVAKLFDLPCNISKNLTFGEPIIDY